MMYDPKSGKGYEAKTKLDHLRMKKMGYSHDKPEVEEGKRGFIVAAKTAKDKGEKTFVFANKTYNCESLEVVEGTLYESKSLKALVSMGMLSKPNMAKAERAMRQLKDADGKALVSLVDGLVKVLSGGEMKEAVELDEASNTISKVKEIVSKKQAMKIDGVLVDMFTASAISQIYDKVNDANKKKMDGLKVTKLADLAMKMMKREGVELDENKNLIKDYEKYMSQGGKKDHNAIDYLMSMPKYKRMSKDQMAKAIGDAKRKGIFREEVELDEAPRRKGAPKMTGDSIKIQRAKDAEHNAAMGRTKTGRKKPVRTMTSTQRSLASLRREAVEPLDDGIKEAFSPKEIKMAIGMAADPRFGNNMTGAVKAIEKLKKGLSSHKQVAAVLKRKNENTNGAVTPFRDYT